MTADS